MPSQRLPIVMVLRSFESHFASCMLPSPYFQQYTHSYTHYVARRIFVLGEGFPFLLIVNKNGNTPFVLENMTGS
jgi:hypothetical protein